MDGSQTLGLAPQSKEARGNDDDLEAALALDQPPDHPGHRLRWFGRAHGYKPRRSAGGHGGPSSGIHKVYAVYKQLQGKCGARQVKGATMGMTHGQGGYPGSSYSVILNVLGTRD